MKNKITVFTSQPHDPKLINAMNKLSKASGKKVVIKGLGSMHRIRQSLNKHLQAPGALQV
ncbi:MAG: hypothetical protein LPJ89_04240 [Hymenobacteraceae bacterium]|nr:hypothetical protein [Hymenobacteraceae bacterium]MDX5396270.1 hypothetical protein [Hymenobacteraceae bacterium]MDX5442974.1 hypothetical protein [Hymenobacteraceae bacterium]MDX5512331.1 hypothetical protein [Hymenobacteraceae bacterium]